MDPYALCPAGTGKKLKFCCPDLLSELDKLQRMIEGEQLQGALDYLDTLAERFPERACLLSARALIEAELGKEEESQRTLAALLAAHPDNPVGLAEAALGEVDRRGPAAAVAMLQQALAATPLPITPAVFSSIGGLAARLVAEGEVIAAMRHILLQMALDPENQQVQSRFMQIAGAPSIPLLLKERIPLADCPPQAAWKKQFDEGLRSAKGFGWSRAEQTFAELAGRFPQEPAVCRNLALVRSWLCHPGAAEAWRRVARMELPLDDRVEAEALAQLLDRDCPSRQVDTLQVTLAIGDIERLMAHLASDRRAVALPQSSAPPSDDEPPPRVIYLLLDRPPLEDDAALSADSVPLILGTVLVFGRQTDREARVELIVDRPQLAPTRAVLGEIARDSLGEVTAEEVLESHSELFVQLQPRWHFPRGASGESMRALNRQHLERVIFERWPHEPQPQFAERTPAEAAADPAGQVPVLAAILNLEQALGNSSYEIDFNRLRRSLGLPEAGLIDPWAHKVGKDFPLSRLARLDAAKLTDEELQTCMLRAATYAARRAMHALGRELLGRDSPELKEFRLEMLQVLSDTAYSLEERLHFLGEGRRSAAALGKSCGVWDVDELVVRLQLGHQAEVNSLMDHLHREHMKEPQVRQLLRETLVAIGAITPDGRPTEALAAPAAAAEAQPAEAGGIWTPESAAAPAGEKPKIWTPGMD